MDPINRSGARIDGFPATIGFVASCEESTNVEIVGKIKVSGRDSARIDLYVSASQIPLTVASARYSDYFRVGTSIGAKCVL
jgi:hypothetical protein